MNEEHLKLLARRRKIVHRAVRPCDEAYDKRYFNQNLDAYKSKVWQPGHVDHEIHIGKIHDLDEEFPNSQVIYQMSDVHYYLSVWKPKNTKKDDYYICVGANFPVALPGHYVLPFNEGTFWIDHRSMLHMQTRGNDHWYTHPLVRLGNVTKEINYGYYSHVVSEGCPDDFDLFTYKPTGFSTRKSIQSNWLGSKLR